MFSMNTFMFNVQSATHAFDIGGGDATVRHTFHAMQDSAQAGGLTEKPGDRGYRFPIGFGADRLTENWPKCGRRSHALNDTSTGTDLGRSLQAVRQA